MSEQANISNEVAAGQAATQSFLTALKPSWGYLLAMGILFLILGFVGLGMTFGLTIVSMLFFGVLLIVGGVLQIVEVFKDRQWKGALWHSLIALLYLVGGSMIIYDPVLASTLITAILAGMLIAIGISRMIMAFLARESKGWGWLFVAGLASLILGLMIMAHWPVSGLWFIGLFIAIEMIINGWSYILLAFAARRA